VQVHLLDIKEEKLRQSIDMGKDYVFASVDDVLDVPDGHIILFCKFLIGHAFKQSVLCHVPISSGEDELLNEENNLVTRQIEFRWYAHLRRISPS